MLRRAPLLHILLACALAVAIGAGAAVAATAGNDPKPPPTTLADAVHQAVTAPRVAGMSADVTVTNALLPGDVSPSSSSSSSPLASGGSGRLWVSADGRARLEIQSDQGDAEIYLEDGTLSYLDAGTLYRIALPADSHHDAPSGTPPSPAQIQHGIDSLSGHARVSGAISSDVAGHAAYEVRVAPSSHGGLVGGAALWWDADHGVPLRFAVYAAGNPQPVLDVAATNVSFGPVAASVFDIPPAAHTVDAALPHAQGGEQATGPLPFQPSEPSSLAGRALQDKRLVELDGRPAELLTYGQGLDGIAVVETQARAGAGHATSGLPTFRLGSVTAAELPTALGTLVHFQRDGVSYALLGSVDRATAQQAAAGL